MRVFRHWVACRKNERLLGNEFSGTVYGGHEHSIEKARLEAERRWTRVCARITGTAQPDAGEYVADIREELRSRPSQHAAITRNRYGAEILNCTDVVIVDVDHNPQPFWRSLLGLRDKRDLVSESIRRVEQLLRKGGSTLRGAKIYRTPNGARILARCDVVNPRSNEIQGLMRTLGVDPLYAILCSKQMCYRARLTAKPARIRMKSLRQAWPVDGTATTTRAQWVEEYTAKAAGFAACRLETSLGDTPDSVSVRMHDSASRARSTLPLA